MILFDPSDQLVSFLALAATVFLPILVGLVTKASTSSATKALLLATLSAVTAIVTALIQVEGSLDLYPVVLSAVEIFVIAVAVHYGLWKSTGVTEAVQGTLVAD